MPKFQFGHTEPTMLKPPLNDTSVSMKRKQRIVSHSNSQKSLAFEPFVDISSNVSFETFRPTIEPFADFSSQSELNTVASQSEETYRWVIVSDIYFFYRIIDRRGEAVVRHSRTISA